MTPQTLIAILSTGDPGQTYTRLWDLVQRHGGAMESVSDREAYDAMLRLAKAEGLAMEPAAAVAFAGTQKLAAGGVIGPDDVVVVNCTGHTFPVEKHVLGEHWSVDVDLAAAPAAPREGLVAALSLLDEKTTTVLLVDDNPDDARLIQRLLETRKSYRVFHAADGADGLAQARQKLPDLIVLDLTMPRLDGFSVLEALKGDRRTRDIPVIVVSAKDLSGEDRQRLDGQIEALYQKGSLSARAFVDKVVNVLGDK